MVITIKIDPGIFVIVSRKNIQHAIVITVVNIWVTMCILRITRINIEFKQPLQQLINRDILAETHQIRLKTQRINIHLSSINLSI